MVSNFIINLGTKWAHEEFNFYVLIVTICRILCWEEKKLDAERLGVY